MDHACQALHAAGQPGGLIACTDADTQPEPQWLTRQLALVGSGARAIAGLVELDEPLPPSVLARREHSAAARLRRVRAIDPGAGHHHFAGASLGITADTYLAVGGLEPLRALEDEAFAERLATHRVGVIRSPDVRVRTSARRDGRAVRGLAVDLDVSQWLEQRRYARGTFRIDDLVAAKGQTRVGVIVPAKDVASTVGGVIDTDRRPPARRRTGRRRRRDRRRLARRHRRRRYRRRGAGPTAGRSARNVRPGTRQGRRDVAGAVGDRRGTLSASSTPTPPTPTPTTSSACSAHCSPIPAWCW